MTQQQKQQAKQAAQKRNARTGRADIPPRTTGTTPTYTTPEGISLTTRADLLADYSSHFVVCESGNAYEIEPLSAIDLIETTGSPVLDLLQQHGADLSDSDSIQETIEQHTQVMAEKLAGDHDFYDSMLVVVCAGVVSMSLTPKRLRDCAEAEVPVRALPWSDIQDLYVNIVEITVPRGDRAEAETFQSEPEAAEIESAGDREDGEDVRTETEPHADEQQESAPDAGD